MWGTGGMKGGSHQLRDDRGITGLAAGQGLQAQGGEGEKYDLFEKGIGNPSLEKTHLLEHLFQTLKLVSGSPRWRPMGDGRGYTQGPHTAANPVLGAGTKPFLAGRALSRAISINTDDKNGWDEGDFSFPCSQTRTGYPSGFSSLF